MSDDAGRRERKAFEPPPWERAQFEELARRKAEEQELQVAEEAAWRGAALAATRTGDTAPQQGGEDAAADGPEADGAPPAAAEKPKPPGVEDARIRAMLLELSSEGGSAVHEVKRAGVVTSYVLGAAGSAVLGLGIVMVFQGGAQGLVGSGMIVFTGMFAIGFAAWLWYRASRGQGS